MFYQDPYIEFVHQQALKRGKYFILDSGEGRGWSDLSTGWEVEDLSGWLIEPCEHERFLLARKNGTLDDDFCNEYVFAKWFRSDQEVIEIDFKRY